MTLSQRRSYARQYLRWHTAEERIARRVVLARLRIIAGKLVATLDNAGVAALMGALDLLISEGDHRMMLIAIYDRTGLRAAEREYNRLVPPVKSRVAVLLTKDRDVPSLNLVPKRPELIRVLPFSERWRAKLTELTQSSETAKRITQMTAKTKQVVRDVLTRGAEQGWDIRKVARKLTSAVVSRTRALLIARTETTRAASAGTEAGAVSTLLKLDKIWIATSDLRTRPDHAAMLHSKPVPKDGYFTVGGRAMKYPGDPAGGAANVCNCRCAVSYIPSKNYFN